ncbi:MAG: hypothetical protein JWN65_2852, partial [Solirubrobacterales bacterium]|nr:hypothetical protein [Solirubrobacterales bacterium]
MSSALRASGEPAVATFAVDRLDVDGDRVVVEGRWSGVRGMRFLRPTLVVDGRQILATLEHKPWAPERKGPWIAAFPWSGAADGLNRAWLEVAPSVTVPIGTAAASRPPAASAPTASVVPMSANLRLQTDAEARAEAEATPAVPDRVETADGARDEELQALRAQVRAAELRAEQHARAARVAAADRDRALAMRDEAVRDREAALRTRDRMSQGHDEALAAAQETQRRCDAAVAEAQRRRDDAVAAAARERDEARTQHAEARAQHAEARAQRDEVLLAHRSLEQVLRGERAGRDREAARPAPQPAPVVAGDDRDDDAPIGVR